MLEANESRGRALRGAGDGRQRGRGGDRDGHAAHARPPLDAGARPRHPLWCTAPLLRARTLTAATGTLRIAMTGAMVAPGLVLVLNGSPAAAAWSRAT